MDLTVQNMRGTMQPSKSITPPPSRGEGKGGGDVILFNASVLAVDTYTAGFFLAILSALSCIFPYLPAIPGLKKSFLRKQESSISLLDSHFRGNDTPKICKRINDSGHYVICSDFGQGIIIPYWISSLNRIQRGGVD